MICRRLLLMGVLCVSACLVAAQEAAKAAEKPADVDLMWGVKIPLRDGVKLNATVHKPHDQKEALPVVFELTPYISDTYHNRGFYFAQHGYVFAIVDVRGRGNSEGHFDPFRQEPRDGHDVVEWLAQQPYCNGKVAMWGGSYAGFDQWLTLREFPPHLATVVPAASAHAGVDFPMFKGIFLFLRHAMADADQRGDAAGQPCSGKRPSGSRNSGRCTTSTVRTGNWTRSWATIPRCSRRGYGIRCMTTTGRRWS